MTEFPALPLFEARGISKSYGAVRANDAVDFDLSTGEIHALLGENGAGKSTLVKAMYGVIQPDSGDFFWNGDPVRILSPFAARARGIGMVFQHFSTFDSLTVAENLALALPGVSVWGAAAKARDLGARYRLTIDPLARVGTLSSGEKQRVEILRCLALQPKLLIMDEPTSVLTPQEVDALFITLRAIAAEGCAILYISHRLEEVRALCQQATVLRQGKVVAQCDPRAESAASLAAMMIGSDVPDLARRESGYIGGPRIELVNLTLPVEGGTGLHDVSLVARKGEVLGIAGVAGEGQAALFAALSGERLTTKAAVMIDGRPVGRLGPNARRRLGAAFAPEERNGHAAAPDMPLSQNLSVTRHALGGAHGTARGPWLSAGRARRMARAVRERFDVRAGGDDPVASALSGGNLQKFVIGREIARAPSVLVAAQPTWGVDAGAAAVIRAALTELAAQGSAVIVISQDLDELLQISDRIAVLNRGTLSEPILRSEATPEVLGLLMGGAASSPAESAA